jgi:hypothetical protein
MMEKVQIKIEYSSIEDRLLLRIAEGKGPDCVEYRLWLTRRFVGNFILAIDGFIGDLLAGDMYLTPGTLEVMKKFQQEAALAKVNFAASFDGENSCCKLVGEPPLLASTFKIKRKAKDSFAFSFLTDNNAGLHLTAGITVVHALQKMFVDSARKAGWLEQGIPPFGWDDKTSGPVLLAS